MSDPCIAIAQTDEIGVGKTRRVETSGRAILIVNIDDRYREDSSLSSGCPLHGNALQVQVADS